jgi:tetratricopeptide (TPR) repeat protein
MVQGSKRASRTNPPPGTLHHTPHRGVWVRCALLTAAIVLVYSNSLSGPFILDDADTVVHNATLHNWADLGRVFAQPRDTPLAGRPLVAFTFALNYAAGGLDVLGYHLTNIAIHTLCALLLFAIVRRTIAPLELRPTDELRQINAENVAFAVALFWAIHPLNTEVVDYVTQRTESLMALCLLAALYAAIRSLAGNRHVFWQIAAVIACGCGMLCKETMVVAPVLIILYERVFFFDSMRGAIAARWRLYGGLALTWLVLLAVMLPGPRSGSVGFGTATTSWNYLLNQALMIPHYLWLSLWPRQLVVNYGPAVSYRASDVWPQALVIIGLVVATLLAFRRHAVLGFLAAWVLITLAPTSSFVPIATEVAAERRMYVPLMAIAALVVLAVFALGRRTSRAVVVICALIAVALGAVTFSRNREYASELSIAESTLARWPTDVAHGMVGSAFLQLHRDEEALGELRLAARTVPRSRYNLGVDLYNLKRFDEATLELEGFARDNPMDELAPSARRALGDAFVMRRKWAEAAQEYQLALSMMPLDADTKRKMLAAMNNQALALATASRFAEAQALFRRVIESDPADSNARRNLTKVLLDRRDAAAAEREARNAIEANPLDAISYDLLGRALAIQGRYDEAIVQLREALKLAPDDAGTKEDLTRVFAAKRN